MNITSDFELETLEVLAKMDGFEFIRILSLFDLKKLREFIDKWEYRQFVKRDYFSRESLDGLKLVNGSFKIIPHEQATGEDLHRMVVCRFLLPFTEQVCTTFEHFPKEFLSDSILNLLDICWRISRLRDDEDDYYKWEDGVLVHFDAFGNKKG